MKKYKYDVAISFAGEYRDYVLNLVQRLEECGIKVFYDNWNIDESWGKELTNYFSKTYVEDALYTISIFSKEYFEKKWTQFEFKNILTRQSYENEYLLPILMGDAKIPDDLSNLCFIRSKEYSIDEIVLIVIDKVKKRKKGLTNNNYIENNYTAEKKTMTVINPDGSQETLEVLLAFEFKDNKKEYVIYTKNEKDRKGNIDVYVSEVKRDSDVANLFGVDDSDWPKVKEVLKELASDNDDDNPLPPNNTSFFDIDGNEIL